MKILFVNNYPHAYLGGGEIQLLALIDGLGSSGVEVAAVCEEGSGLAARLAALGIRVTTCRFSALTAMGCVAHIRRAARECSPDVVQGTGYFTNVLTRLASRRAAWGLVNVVHVEPAGSVTDGGSSVGLALRDALDRMTLSRVDCMVAVSDAVRRALDERFGLGGRVRTIYNGIDAAALRKRASGAQAPDGRGPVIGALTRLERVKGVEYLLRAVPAIAASHPGARFIIAGSGSLESELRVVATATGQADRIEFVGRIDDPAVFLSGLDVVVIPSLAEGLGLTALEAMALGKPVVASAVGGLVDVIEDGVSGLLVQPADPEALASGVCEILADPGRARMMGEVGRRIVEERFGVDRMVGEYIEMYSDVSAMGAR